MYEFQFDDDDYDMYEIIYAENPIKILVDDKFDREWSPLGRRPYYQMRGKRISEQQAFDIICKTDGFFSLSPLELEGSIQYINFPIGWFNNLGHGWVHPNGIIGRNGVTDKYTNIYEFAKEWARYLYNFPFLDLIIGFLWLDEAYDKDSKPYSFDYDRNRDFYNKKECFYDNIKFGIWVHDRRIEIINAERTVEVYKQYEKLYEEKYPRVYSHDCYYSYFHPDITVEYLHKCLLAYGITDPEKFLSEKLSYKLEDIKRIPHKFPF